MSIYVFKTSRLSCTRCSNILLRLFAMPTRANSLYSTSATKKSIFIVENIPPSLYFRNLQLTLSIIKRHNSLASSSCGQIGLSFSKLEKIILDLIQNDNLQLALDYWAVAKTWASWRFVPSSEHEGFITKATSTTDIYKYDLEDIRSLLHQMTIVLIRKPHNSLSIRHESQFTLSPYLIAQRFCHDVFLDYIEGIKLNHFLVPFPITFEALTRWLVLQNFFELASHMLFKMKELNVVPREALIQHVVESWCSSLIAISQESAVACELYVEISMPPKPEVLNIFRNLALNTLSKKGRSLGSSKAVISKFISATSAGYLRLKNPSISLSLYSLLPLPSKELLEKIYIKLLIYYSHNLDTADLNYFECIADSLLKLPIVEPTQNPNRTYTVGYGEKLNIPKLPYYSYPPTRQMLYTILAGYAYHQEIESVVQLMNLIFTGGFPSLQLEEGMLIAVMDGFARYANIPAFKFLRTFWRKKLSLSHPWLPELTVIDALACNRHLNPLPEILSELLSSPERSRELFDIAVQDSQLYLYAFAKKLYYQVASFAPELAFEITQVLAGHENGTPPELWAGWIQGLKQDINVSEQAIDMAQSMYQSNVAHQKYPAFSVN